MTFRNYPEDAAKLGEFLTSYEDATGEHKYLRMLETIAQRQNRVLEISLDDVEAFTDEDFAKAIQVNAPRYVQILSDEADKIIQTVAVNNTGADWDEDVQDILLSHRRQGAQQAAADDAAAAPNLPPSLTRRYEVRFRNLGKDKPMAVRAVRAEHIGALVTVKGIVTRITEVKPMVVVVTYTCDQCGYEVYQEVTSRQFMPMFTCPSERCKQNNTMGKLFMQTRGSRFVKFQEIKLQETADQVPIGHVPRSISVHVRGEVTRSCTAGEVVAISGIFLPMAQSGYRAIRAGLTADTFLEAMSIDRLKQSYTDYTVTEEMLTEIETYAQDAQVYDKLSKSIAPEIYGHDDVKKALLLLLVGGCTRQLDDGMKIRGDINICLMGDPGVAKSQLLKYISSVAPRGVYTTGKGSSGVGLTAAVLRDPLTQELTLEGGALVLADMGVCCIDEFDKMEDTDRTAIHEVMEQQTVSIAKAGITTTLNARTSILAAANPAYGRYNRSRKVTENINLPAALLSRFDLMFLILDQPDVDRDLQLAQHICYVHRTNKAPTLEFDALSPSFMRAYISQARRAEPSVPRELTDYIVAAYAGMRQDDAETDNPTGYTSARTLLAILRLSQALARLRFSDDIAQPDIDEAMRLMHMSKAFLFEEEMKDTMQDPKTAIYNVIRDFSQKQRRPGTVSYADVLPMVSAKGFTKAMLDETLDNYQSINVWTVNESRTKITFV